MRVPWKSEVKPLPVEAPSFGTWVLRSFGRDEPVVTMAFARLEQVCANAASLICGAVCAEPRAFAPPVAPEIGEAALLARRTADGFARALEDRKQAILAWPWDHIATRVTWQLTREGGLSESRVGPALERLAVAYTTLHHEQLASVLSVWAEVAGGVTGGPPPDLVAMGRVALHEFELAAALSRVAPAPTSGFR
ncbi:MAG: hypothetical protein ACKVT1_21015 [Dehalococcoidia bacterium]